MNRLDHVLTCLPLCLACIGLAACGGDDSATLVPEAPDDSSDVSNPDPNDTSVVDENGVARMTSALSRQVADLPPAELAAMVAGNSAFAFAMYEQVALENPGANFFYAPFSISTAMAMAYVGARGTTKDAIADALRFNLDDATLHEGFNALDRALENRQRPAGEGTLGVTLRSTNDIWASLVPHERPLQSYVDALALDYRSKVSLVDFDDKAGARDTINAEVSRQTEGTIEDLLGPQDIQDDTTMVLTNAIYFKAGWATQFLKEATAPAPFHNLDGSEGEVEMMDAIGYYDYAETDAVQALRLPYEGRETALLVLLPKGELSSFEAGLDVSALAVLRAQLASTDLHVRLPSFSLRSALKLKATLKALGMYAGFDDQEADFSGIGPFQQYITEVVHQAFIATDEAGTEAGAATAVIFGEESAGPSGSIAFTADKPFVLLLEDVPTGSVLFAGRYVQAE